MMINPFRFLTRKVELSKPLFHAGFDGDYEQIYSGRTKKESETPLRRVEPRELELMYYSDPVIFNGVNMYMRSVLNGYHINAKNARIGKYFNDLSDRVSFDTLMAQVVQHLCIYGNAWLELIWNKAKNEIVELDIVDPKTMDFIRDPMNKVELDANGKVIGYVQNKNKHNEVKLKPEQIAHFKLYTIADSFLGVGLIEPLYKITQIKMNIQEGIGQSIYRHGFPIFKARLGDEKHQPTSEDMQKFGVVLQKINYLSELTMPYYYNVEVLEGKNVEKLKAHMDFFVDQEVAGLGIPRAIVLGMGDETNRATLDVQNQVWERSLKTIQKILAYNVERKIFQRICSAKNFSECPKIVWDELTTENLNLKAERLAALAKDGLIVPDNSTEDILRRLENLPPRSKDDNQSVGERAINESKRQG